MAITIGLLHIFVGLFVVILASDLDLEYVTNCYMRTYKYHASKPFKLRNGFVLKCWDIIPVYSCWGRCDSSEVGDYKIPYKLTNHTVCTYGGQKSRRVKLRHCHPRHPDPFYEVIDATHCVCDACNSESTSCEGLNG